ncbi:uncharacterized protein LOC127151297 isoform X2 [Cucumis melo]|uniref:Uncharacterized protein LOC127150960 n=1 Tax=Cucumis melo TaxID=3656 RepID=A0ABM3L9L4_CUCME|nr:uncharacterized protein LOC127150960 [Cucumis melo]XP_050946723.1 uncharacterized protein LOC127151297 isoform X2 [Cucumis melo]
MSFFNVFAIVEQSESKSIIVLVVVPIISVLIFLASSSFFIIRNVRRRAKGKGKAFNNTRVKHRVKRSIKVPTISNKLADMMIIHGGNMAKSQSKVLHTQDN